MRQTRTVNTEWLMFFSHLSLKVAVECTIRPIWSTCEEGYKSPAQAQCSLCAGSVTPPFVMRFLPLLCSSVVSSLALLLFVLQKTSHCHPTSFSTFAIALSWLLTGGCVCSSTSVPICKHIQPLSQCTSAVDITGWDVRCCSRCAGGHQLWWEQGETAKRSDIAPDPTNDT